MLDLTRLLSHPVGVTGARDTAEAIAFDAPVIYSPKHQAAAAFRAPPGEIAIVAILGHFGGGKTYLAADLFTELAAEHPSTLPGFSSDRPPRSLISGASFGGIMDGPVTELLGQTQHVDFGLIDLGESCLYGSNPYLQWINGHETMIYSANVLNPVRGGRGPSVCFAWIDEAQDAAFTAGVWRNLFNRVRARGAVRPTILVTGVARRGTELEAQIRPLATTEHRRVHLTIVDITDNLHGLHPGMLAHVLSSHPGSALRRDPDGWELSDTDSVWSTWSDEGNVDHRDLTPLAAAPRHLGVDLRTHAAVVAAVDVPEGLLIVDQIMTDRRSAEEVVNEIERRGWPITAGSTISHDPTLALDELAHFTTRPAPDGRGRVPRWPGSRLVAHRAGPYQAEADGLRAVDRAILDAAGRRRLFVHASLRSDPSRRGVVAALRGYDGWRHSPLAHAADAVRYLVCTRLPIPTAPISGSVSTRDLGPRRDRMPFPRTPP